MDATCKDGLERGDDEDKVIKHPKQRIMTAIKIVEDKK